MTLTMERLLEHMLWANQEVFKLISQMPDSALHAFATDSEWNVAEILAHIAGASGGYGNALGSDQNREIIRPNAMGDLVIIKEKLFTFDTQLLKLAKDSDGEVKLIRDSITKYWKRSTIVSQAVHHATEHRAQAVCALEARGFKGIKLDDFDVWAFETHFG